MILKSQWLYLCKANQNFIGRYKFKAWVWCSLSVRSPNFKTTWMKHVQLCMREKMLNRHSVTYCARVELVRQRVSDIEYSQKAAQTHLWARRTRKVNYTRAFRLSVNIFRLNTDRINNTSTWGEAACSMIFSSRIWSWSLTWSLASPKRSIKLGKTRERE